MAVSWYTSLWRVFYLGWISQSKLALRSVSFLLQEKAHLQHPSDTWSLSKWHQWKLKMNSHSWFDHHLTQSMSFSLDKSHCFNFGTGNSQASYPLVFTGNLDKLCLMTGGLFCWCLAILMVAFLQTCLDAFWSRKPQDYWRFQPY